MNPISGKSTDTALMTTDVPHCSPEPGGRQRNKRERMPILVLLTPPVVGILHSTIVNNIDIFANLLALFKLFPQDVDEDCFWEHSPTLEYIRFAETFADPSCTISALGLRLVDKAQHGFGFRYHRTSGIRRGTHARSLFHAGPHKVLNRAACLSTAACTLSKYACIFRTFSGATRSMRMPCICRV